jgi:hypothetical protein
MRSVSWLFLLIAVPAFAQFKYTAVNVSGAAETEVRGVNNYGEIVGFYRPPTASCPELPSNPQVPICNVKGFKIVNGVLTKLMVPGSLATSIMGVNDYGDLVGFYTKTSSACIIEQHGFIWFHQNVIVSIDYPGAGFCGTDAAWTVPMGINKAGTVVGAYWSPQNGQPGGGFVYKNGQFSVMNLGGPGVCYSCTGVYGIANRGAIVGAAWRLLGVIPMWVSYMKKGSDEDFFSNAMDDSWATGVNDNIDVAGYGVYGNGYFAKHIELNEGTNDAEVTPQFLGVFYPNSVGTYPFAMNNQRSIVGAYMSVDGLMHGFVAAPTF